MTDSPRWERESQEDMRRPSPDPAPTSQETVEFDAVAAALVDHESARERTLAAARESLSATRESLSETAGRVGRWLHSLDRRPEFDAHPRHDPIAALSAGDAEPDDDAPDADARSDSDARSDGGGGPADGHRFPTAPLGYNRQAVDDHVGELEAELEQLRASVDAPISITEEIERLGEQTASILVVAHDKAHETARLAQEQAERAVTDATADARRITAEAQRRLRELDDETDAVWRERERLLQDVRVVSETLSRLAEEAAGRFPGDEVAAVGAGSR